MALQTEIWDSRIREALNTNNEFAQFAASHDSFVINNTVHLPQAGAEPTITRNRTTFPATVTSRTDTDLTYDLDTFDFPPLRVGYVEDLELSYNKWQSVMGQSIRKLNQDAHDWLLYKWIVSLAAADLVTTSGSASANNLIATAATGTRKPLTIADVWLVKKKMDEDSVPYENRYMLLDVVQYYNLLAALGEQAGRHAANEMDQAKGILLNFAGFKILNPRNKVAFAVAAGTTVRTPGHAGAATDSGMSIAWQSDMVCRALGNIELFEAKKDPAYYGDIVSGLARLGGCRTRSDNKGVIGILQGT